MRIWKAFWRWTWRLVAVVVLLLNLRLYAPSPLADSQDSVPVNLVAQLRANGDAIDAGAPEGMQRLFPEGFYFCHLLHGLTWIELAMRDPAHTAEAEIQARKSLVALSSADGKSPFPAYLPPGHGMFYSAWKCHLQAGLVALTRGTNARDVDELRRQCDLIVDTLQQSPTPFPASYDGSAWPCDTVPAIHAMRMHDRITGEVRYAGAIQNWLMRAGERLDSETGLFGHTASLPDGEVIGIARATSQVIILRLLPDIDAEFAREQYEIFRDRFLTKFVGIPCVREYPTGIRGSGDVDSGPLIFGRSPSATVLMIGVAQIFGDDDQANAIAQAGEVVGLPWTSNGRKQYVGGILPVGNIIVAYSHVARRWSEGEDHIPGEPAELSVWWRFPTHAASFAFIALPIWIARRRAAKNDRGGVDD